MTPLPENFSSSDYFTKIRFLILDVDGVLTDGGLYYSDQGEQLKKFNVKDGMGIRRLIQKGIDVALCSNGRARELVQRRADDIGIPTVYVGPRQKQDVVSDWLAEKNLSWQECAYIGDDVNDLPVMALCALTACPADAVGEVRNYVDHVLALKGGEGCVREFIDHILCDTAVAGNAALASPASPASSSGKTCP